MKAIKKIIPVLLILLFVVSLFMIITANKEPKSEGIANQMKEYYLNDTEPEGNTFYDYNVSSTSLPETDKRNM